MIRKNRQATILELIEKKPIDTQDELVFELKNAGFKVTQATVSRDIKELNLIKTSVGGRQRYVAENKSGQINDKMLGIFRHSLLSVDYALNVVVIKTLSGSANAAGVMIDKLNNPFVMGCIAGDDTIFVVCKDEHSAKQLCDTLSNLASL